MVLIMEITTEMYLMFSIGNKEEAAKNVDILFHRSLAVFRTRCSETIECLFLQPPPCTDKEIYQRHLSPSTFFFDTMN